MDSRFNRKIKMYTLKVLKQTALSMQRITHLHVRALLLSHVDVDVA